MKDVRIEWLVEEIISLYEFGELSERDTIGFLAAMFWGIGGDISGETVLSVLGDFFFAFPQYAVSKEMALNLLDKPESDYDVLRRLNAEGFVLGPLRCLQGG